MVSLTDWVNWLPMSSRDPPLLELQTHSAAPSFHMGAVDLRGVVSVLARQALSLWPQVKIILNSEVINSKEKKYNWVYKTITFAEKRQVERQLLRQYFYSPTKIEK